MTKKRLWEVPYLVHFVRVPKCTKESLCSRLLLRESLWFLCVLELFCFDNDIFPDGGKLGGWGFFLFLLAFLRLRFALFILYRDSFPRVDFCSERRFDRLSSSSLTNELILYCSKKCRSPSIEVFWRFKRACRWHHTWRAFLAEAILATLKKKAE